MNSHVIVFHFNTEKVPLSYEAYKNLVKTQPYQEQIESLINWAESVEVVNVQERKVEKFNRWSKN